MRMRLYSLLTLVLSILVLGANAQTAINLNTGATFTGATALSSAVAAVATANGHTIKLSTGTFNGGFTIDKRVTIIGSGNGTSGTLITASSQLVLNAAGGNASTRIILRNLRVNRTATGQRIQISNAAAGRGFITLENVYFVCSTGNGIDLTSISDNGVNVVEDVIINNCIFDGSGNGGTSGFNGIGHTVASAFWIKNIVVSNCQFRSFFANVGNNGNGMNITPGNTGNEKAGVEDVTISNCLFENITAKGLYFERAKNVTIENCTFKRVGNQGNGGAAGSHHMAIDINLVGNRNPAGYGTSPGLKAWTNGPIVIRNNYFIECGLGTGMTNGGAMTIKTRNDNATRAKQAASVGDITIEGNMFNNNGFGVRFGESNNNGIPTAGLGFNFTGTITVRNNAFIDNLKTGVPANRQAFELRSLIQRDINAQRNFWTGGSAPSVNTLDFTTFQATVSEASTAFSSVTNIKGAGVTTGRRFATTLDTLADAINNGTGGTILVTPSASSQTISTYNGGTLSGAFSAVLATNALTAGTVATTQQVSQFPNAWDFTTPANNYNMTQQVTKNGAWDVDVTNNLTGKYVVMSSAGAYVSDHSTLSAALSAATSGQQVLVLDETVNLSVSSAIPAGITLVRPGSNLKDSTALKLSGTLSGNVTLKGCILTGSASFSTVTVPSNSQVTLEGNSITMGNFSTGTRSGIRFTGAGNVNLASGALTTHDLIIAKSSGKVTLGQNTTVNGTLFIGTGTELDLSSRTLTLNANPDIQGTFTTPLSSTLVLGVPEQLPTSITSLGGLTVNGGNAFRLAANMSIGNITLNGGSQIFPGSNVLTLNGTLTPASGVSLAVSSPFSSLIIGSTGSYPSFGTVTFQNLTINSSTATLTGSPTVNGTLSIGGTSTVSSTAALSMPSGSTLSIASGGTFNNNNTITFAGGSTFTNNGTLSHGNGNTTTFAASSTFTNNGTVAISTGNLVLNVNPTGTGTVTAGVNSGLTLNASANIPSGITTLGTLTVNRSGAYTLPSDFTITNLNLSSTLNIGANTLTLSGPVTGVNFLNGGSTSNLTLNGVANSVPNVGTLNLLTINSTSPASLNGNLTLKGTLSLSNNLSVGNNSLSLEGNPVISGASNLTTTYQSKLNFNGAAYTLTGTRSLGELNVHGSNSITLANPTTVYGKVRIQGSGNLASGGNLILGSNTFVFSAQSQGFLVINGSGTVTGNIQVQRATFGSNSTIAGARHYSSPITSATVATLASTASDVEQWVETSNNGTSGVGVGWTAMASTSDPLVVGRGYARKNSVSSGVVTFTGAPNLGNQVIGLTRTGTNGWNLVGNPYPFTLDWDLTTADPSFDNTKMFTGKYHWVARSTDVGYWAAYVNGVPAARKRVPIAGAFMVRVKSGTASVNLTFKNSHRDTSGTDHTFQRIGSTDTRPQIGLTLAQTGVNNADEAYLYMQTGASLAFDDGFDAVKNNGVGMPSLAFRGGTTRMAINGIEPAFLTNGAQAPLDIRVNLAGNYTINTSEFLNLDGFDVLLFDNDLGTVHNLTALGAYNFSTNVLSIPNRFTIGFTPTSTTRIVQGLQKGNVQVYPNPSSAGLVNVEVVGLKAGSQLDIRILNFVGAQVASASAEAGNGTAKVIINTVGLTSGMYVAEVISEGRKVSHKIVIE